MLWCYISPDRHKQETKDSLSLWWNIKDRNDLLTTLGWIDKAGHRELWNDYQKANASGELKALKLKSNESDSEIEERMKVVRSERAKLLGSKSLIGWDYCRYIALCRWGVVCGYLTPEEAWGKIMPVARRLQQTFSSWSDLGENYLIGRSFWSSRETDNSGNNFLENYNKLLDDPLSPWNLMPWNTKLVDSDKVAQ